MLPRARVRACTASASQNATRVEEQLPRAAVPRVLEAVVVEQSPSGIAAVHDLGDVMLGVVLLALGSDRAHLVLVQLHEELPAGAGGRNLGVVVHAVDGELDELAALAVLELVGVAQEMGAQVLERLLGVLEVGDGLLEGVAQRLRGRLG